MKSGGEGRPSMRVGAGPRMAMRSSCAERRHVTTHGYLVFTGRPVPVWLHVVRQGARVDRTCDSGGPAIVELALGRPETLRPHLSAGLPLSESRGPNLTTNASHNSRDAGHSSSSNTDVRKRRHWISSPAFNCCVHRVKSPPLAVQEAGHAFRRLDNRRAQGSGDPMHTKQARAGFRRFVQASHPEFLSSAPAVAS